MANITDVKLPDNSQYDLKDNVSGYASKVLSATTDDLASLTATGDLADSGKKLSDLVLKSDVKDVLNSTSTTDPLSANQGKVLADNLAANENVYGAKQMLPYPFNETTKTDNGITFTDNGNGTITVNGIASNDTNFFCRNRITDPMYLKNGTYKFTGCPSGGGSSSYEVDLIYQDSGGSIIYLIDVGNGLEFTVNGSYGDADGANFGVIVTIYNGANLTTPITFEPMIRDARIVDDTFVPYAKTNKQLTNDKAERKDLTTIFATGATNNTGAQINAGAFFYLNGVYCKAKTNIAADATFTRDTNFEVVNVGEELSKKIIVSKYTYSGADITILVGTRTYLTPSIPAGYKPISAEPIGTTSNPLPTTMSATWVLYNSTHRLNLYNMYEDDITLESGTEFYLTFVKD